MKTLQVVGASPYGGGSYLVVRWTKWLLSRGHSVHVLATDPRFVRELSAIPGLVVLEDPRLPVRLRPFEVARASLRLGQLLYREKYDVVQSYTSIPGFIARIVGRICGVRRILHHQAGWPGDGASAPLARLLFNALEALAVACADKSICVSGAVMEAGCSNPLVRDEKLTLVRNGIDVSQYSGPELQARGRSIRKDLGLEDEDVLLLWCGRFAAQKAPEEFIAALDLLARSEAGKRPWRAVMIGAGPDLMRCQSEVGRLGLEKRVHLLGSKENVNEFLAACDIFVSTSRWEGLSIAILESMAAGVVSVCSGIAPNRELVRDGLDGLLYPAGDTSALATAIGQLLGSPSARGSLGRSARTRALAEFTQARMFEETMRVYQG